MLPDRYNINELLFRLLDNEISDTDFERLESWVNSGDESRQYYCRFMEDYSALALRATTVIQVSEKQLQHELLNEHFWKLMSAEEENAPAAEAFIPRQQPKYDVIQKVQREPVVRTLNKTSLLVAVLSLAALFLMIAYVYLSGPAPYQVATISDSIDAQWSSEMPPKPGTRLSSNSNPIRLTQGIVKLSTDDNVEVVLEAPTEFRFTSYSEIALGYGKLFARVSGQGCGFSVATPNSKIVDLGTEFGVLCGIDGNTEVYMYKGKANIFAGQKNENKISEFLTAGSARKVDRKDSIIKKIALEENIVVRNIDSKSKFIWKGRPLSLADIVGGGNGFGGGVLDTGIDVFTGQVLTRLRDGDTHQGSAGYRPVPENPYIDGVFIPGLEPDKTQITSNGIFAESFPKTTGFLWGYIFNGAFHEGVIAPSRHVLRLDGTVFGTPANPAITIHSNQGITFDLNTIRGSIPNLTIQAFRSLAGVSQTVQSQLQQEQGRSFQDFPEVKKVFDANRSKVEFWVFLDGKQVYHCQTSSADKASTIDIPITDQDRFLTLAVTESDDTHAYDWALFARPELIIESSEQETDYAKISILRESRGLND